MSWVIKKFVFFFCLGRILLGQDIWDCLFGIRSLNFKGSLQSLLFFSLRDQELRYLGALLFLNFVVGLDLSFFEFSPIRFLVAAFLVHKVFSLNFASLLR